jgi:hypothetical protein
MPKDDLKVYEKKEGVKKVEGLMDIKYTSYSTKKEEPLLLEISDFIDCIKKYV